jgi:hypothetical protein
VTKYKITYIKTKTIVTDETTIVVEAEDANKAVEEGYERLGWDDWDLDTCVVLKD